MFQVASHPSSFDFGGVPHHVPVTPLPTLNLPRNLTRPAFVEVPVDNLPRDVSHVPPAYLRASVPKSNLAATIATIKNYIPNALPKSRIPSSFSVPIGAPLGQAAANYPTHIVGIISAKPNSQDPEVLLMPIHQIALASHCASVPRIPSNKHDPRSTSLHLPVILLSVPSPAGFRLVYDYMYHHRLDRVISGLFPIPSALADTLKRQSASPRSLIYPIAEHVAASAGFNPESLVVHVSHIKELWQDMISLGVNDPDMWTVLELSWDAILGALKIAADRMN